MSNLKPESALAVANYFIKKRLDTGEELTPMKLIKLCYIAHGWYCGFNNGEPLLGETIYAWKYGPVIESIYENFRHYGSGQINALYDPNPFNEESVFPMPNESVQPFLDAVWRTYGRFDGIKLSSMTHQPGTPWDRVWNQEGGKNKRDAVIPNDYITEYYQTRISESKASATV